jgi:hypothetical protein
MQLGLVDAAVLGADVEVVCVAPWELHGGHVDLDVLLSLPRFGLEI